MQRVVAALIALIAPVIGVLDVFLFKFWGNAFTISRVYLAISFQYPWVPIFSAYGFGVLMRHLALPSFTLAVPNTVHTLATMIFILSPVLYVLIIIGFSEGGIEDAEQRWTDAMWWQQAVLINAAFSFGMVMGRYLPQHLAPQIQMVAA